MANTTDLMITSFFDDKAIEYISQKTGLDFLKVTDGENSGGTHALSFESFGVCLRSIGADRIKSLVSAFKEAPFTYPEYAFLFIDDDCVEEFNGVVARERRLK